MTGPTFLTPEEYENVARDPHKALRDSGLLDWTIGEGWQQLPSTVEKLEQQLLRAGNTYGPVMLSDALEAGIDPALVRSTICGVWSAAHFPEQLLDSDTWIEMFRLFPTLHATPDGNVSTIDPPTEIVLYRGGIDPIRMAWTDSRDKAEWFQARFSEVTPGRLYRAIVPGVALLARIEDRGESEWVVDAEWLVEVDDIT